MVGLDLTAFPVPASKLPHCDSRAFAIQGDVTRLLTDRMGFARDVGQRQSIPPHIISLLVSCFFEIVELKL